MEVHIELDIECRGQCERSADEVYVTAGLARAGGTGHTRCVWAGPLSWAPPAVHRSGPIDVWRAGLEPGENALLLLNLNEQDGFGYEPGERLAERMIRRAAGCLADAHGDPSAAIDGLDFDSMVERAHAADGVLHGDQLIGSLLLFLHRGADGGIDGRLHPVTPTDRSPEGQWVCRGAGGQYHCEVRVNGHRLRARPAAQTGRASGSG